jgi:hydrogenase/urease accessory protein HupE
LTDALVRISFLDGTTFVRRLTPQEPAVRIPERQSGWSVAEVYFKLGVEHILLGIDHLLFVLALMLITRGTWLLIKTVTAFTVAHSITLAAATLGYVHVPSAPVEAAIALSIVFVAVEIVRASEGRISLTARLPWVVAFTFGLLHGLGFAGALSEIGLPEGHIPLALLFFNVGVEIGQLLFIGLIVAATALIGRIRVAWPRWAGLAAPYAIGSIAMFWVFERVAEF